METWHNRLQHALDVRGYDWPDLVRVTGLSKPSVYAWKPNATKRTTMMEGGNAAKVCTFLRINSRWLFDNALPSGLEDRVSPSSDTQIESEGAESPKNTQGGSAMQSNVVSLRPPAPEASFVRFEIHPVRMSAGPGALLEEPYDVVEYLDVAKRWAQSKLGSCDPRRIKIVTCAGSSMDPTIRNGDLLFVDIGIKSFFGDGIYCLDWNGMLLVKRLVAIAKNRCIEIRSDNPNGPNTETVRPDEFDQLAINGKVMAWWSMNDG